MLRFRVNYTTEPDNIAPGFRGYLDAMTDHCPFVRPSLQRRLTRWLLYEATADVHQLPDLQREIFAVAVEHMELLRNRRRSRPSADAVLLCDNVVIRWAEVQDATAHRSALEWPHWILKTIYTPLGYMIGKLSLHAHGADRRSSQVSPVPISFLSLRVAVRRKDPQFLHEPPRIAAQLVCAVDEGQHPLVHVPDLADLPLCRSALQHPERYRRVEAWARAQIPAAVATRDRHTGSVNRCAAEVVIPVVQVGDRLGEACAGVQLVTDRRGSRVYRLHFPTGDVALKLAFDNHEGQGVREAERLAGREAAVLAHLLTFAPGYLIDSGHSDDGGSWLALRWIEGITVQRLFAPTRRGDDSPARRERILSAALDITHRLAQLHALGWLHADLQPAHILLADTAVHLIDFALAQGPHPLQPEVTYRGGMVHFTAPEIAAEILATPANQTVTLDESAEVYALAAVLHLAWTGLPPTNYTDDHASWHDKLKDIAHQHRYGLASIRPWPWPAFEDVLNAALTFEPEGRISSMTRFHDALLFVNSSI